MLEMLAMLASTLGSALKTRQALTLENLALRHQLAVLQRSARRPRMRRWDQLLWVLLRQLWADWANALVLVRPATVVRWHRAGFSRYWRRRSGRPPGRPPVGSEIRALIRRMAKANPLWGAPRIHGELLQLGIDVSERTVSRCMPSARQNPPSQTWRTFLNNHLHDLVSIDFFTVKTAMFRVVFVLIIVSHTRRRVLHLNVTQHPTAEWTARQVVEAFPWDTAPRYLLRDRDSIYGAAFRRRMAGLGITEVLTAPHAPWQNPYAERLIGSIRRECLDHVVPWNEAHLRRLLRSYFDYYHRTRTHLSLGKDAPDGRRPQRINDGAIVELSEVGGLHHRYERRAAYPRASSTIRL